MISDIDAATLSSELQAGRKLALLDVREGWEVAAAPFPGAAHVPMQSVPSAVESLREMQGDGELVVICHHGTRSMHVAQFLAGQGFTDLINLRGGIDAWSRQVDPSIPLY